MFLGGGDWNLCCAISPDLYYYDTPACKSFIEKLSMADAEGYMFRQCGTGWKYCDGDCLQCLIGRFKTTTESE